MKCLDTCALVEIMYSNKKFADLLEEDFVIADLTFAEFCGVVFREHGREAADNWYKKLLPYVVKVPVENLVKAIIFRNENKNKGFSVFDAVAYIFSIENNCKFVTGDKAFKGMKNVELRKK